MRHRAREPSYFPVALLGVFMVIFAAMVMGTLPATASNTVGAPICALAPAGIFDSPLTQDQGRVKAFIDDIVAENTSQPFCCYARAPDVPGQVLTASRHNYIIDVQTDQMSASEFTAEQQAATGTFYVYSNDGTTATMPFSGAIHLAQSGQTGENRGRYFAEKSKAGP